MLASIRPTPCMCCYFAACMLQSIRRMLASIRAGRPPKRASPARSAPGPHPIRALTDTLSLTSFAPPAATRARSGLVSSRFRSKPAPLQAAVQRDFRSQLPPCCTGRASIPAHPAPRMPGRTGPQGARSAHFAARGPTGSTLPARRRDRSSASRCARRSRECACTGTSARSAGPAGLPNRWARASRRAPTGRWRGSVP